MLTSLSTLSHAMTVVDILLVDGMFSIQACMVCPSGMALLEPESPSTLDETLRDISDYILSWHPPSAFTVDGVVFPTAMPIKYLHHALTLMQTVGHLTDEYKQRVTQISGRYINV